MDRLYKVHFLSLVALATAVFVAACVHQGVATDMGSHAKLQIPIHLQVQQCIDRTDTEGRDLGKETTQAFVEKLGATSEFVVQEKARYQLSCEVTGFEEGSAIKRWLLPGWGTTVGRVTAMLTDSTTGEILVVVEGNATVSGGG